MRKLIALIFIIMIYYLSSYGDMSGRRENIENDFHRPYWVFFKKSFLAAEKKNVRIPEELLRDIVSRGGEIRREISLIGAVSVNASKESISMIKVSPFVSEVKPLALGKRKSVQPLKAAFYSGNPMIQLEMINIPALHDEGYHGEGVRIGVLDTGFDLSHHAFDSIKIVAAYDFIQNDTIVRNEDGKDLHSQQDHGSNVLSIIGGNLPGKYQGPAYKAEFIIGKTEDVGGETRVEEDNYVAGLQFCADHGATVISTSLGYIDWYSYSELDGETSVASQMVNALATEKDIMIVTAMGNEGSHREGTLITPSDSPWALSIGAVDDNENLACFSGTGPTADGRIKPDVLAHGVSTYYASRVYMDELSFGDGTSYATPLAAGAVALIRQKNPAWDVSTILVNIRNTASRANNPDNFNGYGIMDAKAASDVANSGFSDDSEKMAGQVVLYPNPVRKKLFISGLKEYAEISIFNILGEEINVGNYDVQSFQKEISLDVSSMSSGVYLLLIKTKDKNIRKVFTKLK